jgi:hypothetical protein
MNDGIISHGLIVTPREGGVALRKESAFSLLPWTFAAVTMCCGLTALVVYLFNERAACPTLNLVGTMLFLVAGIALCIWWIKWSLQFALPAVTVLTRVDERCITIRRTVLLVSRRFVMDGSMKIIVKPTWGHHGSWGFELFIQDDKKLLRLTPPSAVASSLAGGLMQGKKLASLISKCLSIDMEVQDYHRDRKNR